MSHIPVMLKESLQALDIKENMLYIDCTFGRGSYTKEILSRNDTCQVLAIDRDPEAVEDGSILQDEYPNRLHLVHNRFSNLKNIIESLKNSPIKLMPIDGIVLDLGVSSPQIDNANRGFSFQSDGPLDMRMGLNDFSAYALVNEAKEKKLADIIYIYGDENNARKIARAIVDKRKNTPIKTTLELTNIIHEAIGLKKTNDINSATKTFQALRIAVNEELFELEECLEQSVDILCNNGHLVVVTFHSGEDRIVKNFFKEKSEIKTNQKPNLTNLELLKVSSKEIQKNKRSRSAKIRVAEKIGG